MKKTIILCLALLLIFVFGSCEVIRQGDGVAEVTDTASFGLASADSSSASHSSATSQSSSGGGEVPQTTESDYVTRLEKALEGATVTDAAFIDYYKNLGPYDFNAKEVAGAKYASPTGNGEGTKADPYSLQDGLDEVKAGETLYLRGGTYTATNADGFYLPLKGSAGKYVTVRNYPGETVVVKNSYVGNEASALQIDDNACYFVLEGLEITGVTSKTAVGIVAYGNGQNHVIIRNNKINNIKTNSGKPETDEDAGANGILLFGESANAVSQFIIADNDIRDNVTGWSESLSMAGNCEYMYVIGNTLDNNTNIGIDFYGNAKYCKTPALDQPRYCVAAYNKISRSRCNYADCAGLYVDGARDCVLQYNEITNSQFGIEIGSEERNDSFPVKNIVVRYNVVKNNDVVGIRVGGYDSGSKTGYVTATQIYGNMLYNNDASGDSAEIVVAKCDGVSFSDNKVYAVKGLPVGTDFSAEYTKNLSFSGNVFYAEGKSVDTVTFYIYKNTVTGLSSFNALFSANKYEKLTV